MEGWGASLVTKPQEPSPLTVSVRPAGCGENWVKICFSSKEKESHSHSADADSGRPAGPYEGDRDHRGGEGPAKELREWGEEDKEGEAEEAALLRVCKGRALSGPNQCKSNQMSVRCVDSTHKMREVKG